MIEELRISNLGVIETAVVACESGMTALTGETGAGKTMTVTALQLLMGGRADSERVRTGSDKAIVEGVLTFPPNSPALEHVRDVGADVEFGDGGMAHVIVARHIPASGRARAFVGGRSVPASVLSQICAYAVTLHGQTDQLRLAQEAQQRAALDAYGGSSLEKARAAYVQAWHVLVDAHAAVRDFDAAATSAERERVAMQMLVNRVDTVQPYVGEDEELKAEASRLENVELLRSALAHAVYSLSSEDPQGALELVDRSVHELRRVNDTQIGELADQLADLNAALSDVHATLDVLLTDLNADPNRLDAIHVRRAQIRSLERDLGMSVEEMLEQAETARISLQALDDPSAHRALLLEKFEHAMNDAQRRAAELTAQRRSAAEELAHAVNAELAQLYMKDARFSVEISQRDQLAVHGADHIRFMLAPHAGTEPMQLGRTASGGEMSRIMLALEVSLAGRMHSDGHTFIFDEIDAGIGGKSALAVGQRLAQLAKHSQVLCVTHLAQVAAYAQHHIVVAKHSDATGASTTVRVAQGEEREIELARMLSGHDESHAARAHAAELLLNATVAP